MWNSGESSHSYLSYLVLWPSFILHSGFHVHLNILSFTLLLLDQGGTGNTEDAMHVDAHFDLHFGALSIRLGDHILNRKTPWESKRERDGGRDVQMSPDGVTGNETNTLENWHAHQRQGKEDEVWLASNCTSFKLKSHLRLPLIMRTLTHTARLCKWLLWLIGTQCSMGD